MPRLGLGLGLSKQNVLKDPTKELAKLASFLVIGDKADGDNRTKLEPRTLQNGVKNDDYLQRVSVDVVLQASNVTAFDNSAFSGFDFATISILNNQNTALVGGTSTIGKAVFDDFVEFPFADRLTKVVTSTQYYVSGSTGGFIVAFPKGQVSSLDNAKISLAGTVIRYQLATPIDTLNSPFTNPWTDLSGGQEFIQGTKFIKPNDFVPELPCNFYYDDVNFFNDMDFSQFIYPNEIYVNLDTGSDSNNGSLSTPVKTIGKAIDLANAGVHESYTIKILNDSIFYRDEGIQTRTIQKNISIIPDNTSEKIILTTAQRGLSWVVDDNVFRTSRSNTFSIFDTTALDADGKFTPFSYVSSVVLCKSTPKSWFTDGTLVYVNNNGVIPTSEAVLVCVQSGNTRIEFNSQKTFYLENVENYEGTSQNGFFIYTSNPTMNGTFVANNCSFHGGDLKGTVSGNSDIFSASNLKNVLLFNCLASYGQRDGFNYNSLGEPIIEAKSRLVVEYKCEAKNVGYLSPETNNNATTAHNGLSIIRFGTKGNGKSIPLADVNGCYSICLGCEMSNADANAGQYSFSDGGKAILYKCKSDNLSLGLRVTSPTIAYLSDFVGTMQISGGVSYFTKSKIFNGANILSQGFNATSASGWKQETNGGKTFVGLQFDGANDLGIGNNPKLDIVGTIDFGIGKVTKVPTLTTRYLLTKAEQSEATMQYGLKITNTGVLSIILNGTDIQLATGLLANTLYAIWVERVSGVLKCFINGVEVFSVANNTSLVSRPNFVLGAMSTNAGGTAWTGFSNAFVGCAVITKTDIPKSRVNFNKIVKKIYELGA